MNKIYSVYLHTNKISNKMYLGITGQNPIKRWQNGKHYSGYFGRAINKYGWDNFEHDIIFECSNIKYAQQLEKYIIKCLNLCDPSIGYNLTKGGEGIFGYKHTEETKIKIGKLLKGNTNKLNSTQSNEIKKKISNSLKGRVITDEWKEKIKNGHVKNMAKITKEDVLEIRKRKVNNEKIKYVYKDYESVLSFSGFQKVWYNLSWKDVV